MRRAFGALAVAALLGLAGCSGVPARSAPEIVRSIGGNQSSVAQPTTSPSSGADPRAIVTGFLTANVSTDERHTAARLYLTPDASRRWQDGTITVIKDGPTTSLPVFQDESTASVSVSATRVGQVDARGIYTPVLRPVGEETFTFGAKQVDGQWRIDQLQQGVLITATQFQSTYVARPVYFFDLTESTLIPDVRYTATSGQSLASFLMDQLVAGPRPELLSSVQTEIPDQGNTQRKPLILGNTIGIELAGVKQLDVETRRKLAAQLAHTLDPISAQGFRLTENGQSLPFDGARTEFSKSDFSSVITDRLTDSAAYYLHDGVVVSDVDGKPVGGQVGTTALGLTAIAVRPATNGPRFAGTVQSGGGVTLYLGGLGGNETVQASKLVLPQMTRPSWAAVAGEVWVSDGSRLFRVRADGSAAEVAISGTRSDGGVIRALRVARDGTRIALIYGEDANTRAVWVGSIVRSGADVKVDRLLQVTPQNLVLSDVAWNDETTLLMVGRDSTRPPSEFGVWSVQVDGSLLRQRSTAGLPAAPVSITAGPGQLPWVEAEGTVWEQRGSAWFPPRGDVGVAERGTAPVYTD